MNFIALVVAQAILASSGMVFLKKATSSFADLGPRFWLFGLIGLALTCGSFSLWFLILSKSDLSMAFPLATSFNLLITAVASVLFLGEKIGISQLFGILMIAIGAFFVVG